MEPGPEGVSEVRSPEIIGNEMLAAARKPGGWDIPGILSGALELSQAELTDNQRDWLRGFGKKSPDFRRELRQVIAKGIIERTFQEQDKAVEFLKLARILGVADPIDDTPEESELSQTWHDFLKQEEAKYGLSSPSEPSFPEPTLEPLPAEELAVPVTSVPAETPVATEAGAAQEIKTYEGPWESHFPKDSILRSLGSSLDVDVYLAIDPSTGAEVVVKVYKEGRGNIYNRELAALTALRDLDCVPGIIGHGGPGNQFIVKEFIKGENIEYKSSEGKTGIFPVLFPVKPGQYNYEGLEQELKKTVDWTISSLEALAKIHEQGYSVGNFRLSDFPLRENGKAAVVDFGSGAPLSEEEYFNSISRTRDIQFILRPLFYGAGVGGDVITIYSNMVHWRKPSPSLRIATPGEIKEIKKNASAQGAVPAFMRIIDLMENDNNSAQEYADAIKDYFREVGLLGSMDKEGEPLFVRPIPSQHIQSETEVRYKKLAKEKGLKPVEGGTWFCPDEIEYSPLPHLEEEYFTSDWERQEAHTYLTRANDFRRQDEVGGYHINNGIVAWVDENGDKWIGPATKENLQVLLEAKYVSGDVGVPFSNGERPVDTKIRGQLNTVFAAQRQEAAGKLWELRRELRTPKPSA